jgi:hypothetical protein
MVARVESNSLSSHGAVVAYRPPAGDKRCVYHVSKCWQALSSELPRESQSSYGVWVGGQLVEVDVDYLGERETMKGFLSKLANSPV